MYHTCYCINPVSYQMLSAGILGHSPVAQGFFQSYQPQMSASYPYSTPLGPLSPFAAVSGSLPVRYYHHVLLTSLHWHLSTTSHPSHCHLSTPSPFILAPLHPLTFHTTTSPSSYPRVLVPVPYNTCRRSALALASPPPPPSPSPQAHHHPSAMALPIGTPWLRWSHTPLRTEPLVLPPNLPPW